MAMAGEFERKHHQALADVIEHVLRHRQDALRVPDLAALAGFSRFHLVRLFREVTGETLEAFIRRIRMERSAFGLLHTDSTVAEIASSGGYKSPEAFARAFGLAHGVSPRLFRRDGKRGWKLPSPVDLHWNEHWGSEDFDALPGRVACTMQFRPRREAAVWRWIGNYGRLSDGWSALQSKLGSPLDGKTFITLYHDNMWTHPTSATMRADLGWYLEPGEFAPEGMKRKVVPAGMYVVTERFLERCERNDAWSYVGAKWPDHGLSFDEYPAWPLPFEDVRTRIVLGCWSGL